nr:hypothetical protein [Tanacetum cinerariifolium]
MEIICCGYQHVPKWEKYKLQQSQVISSTNSLGHVHKKNMDFAYLLWEDFLYQVEHKDAKKSNEMYYPRFIKVIINFFMTKDPSIPRRNKNTQQFGATLHFESTNEDIKNSATYKEYYAIAPGVATPKTKASVRKMQSNSDTTMPFLTDASTRLLTSAKGKQPAKSSKTKSLQQTHISQASGSGVDEGTGIILGVPDVPTDESDEEISWKSSDDDDDEDQDDDDQDDKDNDQDSDNDCDDFVHPKLSTYDEEAKDEDNFDLIVQTPSQVENSDDESQGMNSSSVSSQFVTSMLNPSPDIGIDSLFESTHQDTYGDTVTLKRRHDDEDKDEEPSAGSDRRAKRRRKAEEPMQITQDLEEPSHQEFKTGVADDQPVVEASQNPEWFQKQTKPPTPDRAWNKTLPATHRSIQPWISDLAKQADSRTSFNELMDTPMDFLAFLMNTLKVDTLTPELLSGPTYKLMKGSCKSLVKLKFFLKKSTRKQPIN